MIELDNSLYSRIICERSRELKHWAEDSLTSSDEVYVFGEQKLYYTLRTEIGEDGWILTFHKAEPNLEVIQKVLLDLFSDYLGMLKKMDGATWKEFRLFISDSKASLQEFKEEEIKFVEKFYSYVMQEILTPSALSQGQQEISPALNIIQTVNVALAQKFFPLYKDFKVNAELVDFEGKTFFFRLDSYGDPDLYLEKLEEILNDVFHDCEINCILVED
ncbi:MAG: hypothetical protein H6620_05765 [Halobacteriovoraceae bacterium]|nr:hypothetical protein [Halobacteriovoraceae bacterium]